MSESEGDAKNGGTPGSESEAEGATTLEFDTGTRVVVYGPKYMDKGQLEQAAELVKKMALKTICTCFCHMQATVATSYDASDPYAEMNCVCRENDSGVIVNEEEKKKNEGSEAKAWVAAKPKEGRYRYEVPEDIGYTLDGLLVELDAGDRESYNPSKDKKLWRDTRGSGLVATLTGAVYVNETEGGGSLHFGSKGAEDRAQLPLDISPQARGELTVEVWVKLASVANPFGMVVGQDRAKFGKNSFDRCILAHDTRFVEPAELGLRKLRGQPRVGKAGLGVGHTYASHLSPPAVGEWMQLVGVWRQGDDSMLYRDTVKDVVTHYTNNGPGEPSLTIGNHPRLKGQHINGYIGAVRVYDRALSDDEVARNYLFFAKRFGLG